MKTPSKIEIIGDQARICLSGRSGTGSFAIIDANAVSIVSDRRWSANKSTCGLYALSWKRTGGVRTITLLHRLIAGAPEGTFVDHINGDTLCNLRSNLRFCTQKENTRNRRKHRNGLTSKFKGVYWNKIDKRFIAQITVDGKWKYLGSFKIEADAAEAYNKAATLAFGEFSRLNQIERAHG